MIIATLQEEPREGPCSVHSQREQGGKKKEHFKAGRQKKKKKKRITYFTHSPNVYLLVLSSCKVFIVPLLIRGLSISFLTIISQPIKIISILITPLSFSISSSCTMSPYRLPLLLLLLPPRVNRDRERKLGVVVFILNRKFGVRQLILTRCYHCLPSIFYSAPISSLSLKAKETTHHQRGP